ncbi:ATP-binding protein [Streptomyces sp. NPDC048436]|uniref:ATP-binding protein n=1 Tax=Streptomyces sp. NPDC048436 TaxID=3365550 RepID=UPI00371A5B58
MGGPICEVPRIGWELAFVAEPEEVAALRRIIRLHLVRWGLPHMVDTAQLCVSELVTNVIDHVGVGTPTVLGLSMRGAYVRIEVRDPDARALPTLVAAERDAEGGRGMAIVSEVAERWGVLPGPDSKVTWCELEAGGGVGNGAVGSAHVGRAEAVLEGYLQASSERLTGSSRLATAATEMLVIDVLADLLHWLHAHGCDMDGAWDRAQSRFEGAWAASGDVRSG